MDLTHFAEGQGFLHDDVCLFFPVEQCQDLRPSGKGGEIFVAYDVRVDGRVGPSQSFFEIGVACGAELGCLVPCSPCKTFVGAQLAAKGFQLGFDVVDLHFKWKA